MARTASPRTDRDVAGGSVEDAPDRIDVEEFLHHPRLSREQRRAEGKATRSVVPLDAHAGLPDVTGRDAVGILREQEADRVQELVPLRYQRMSESPFAFLRGSAAVMAADLATVPSSGITVQLCGDAHVANFGIFATPERRTVFDLNDFDETLRGPFEWDVKRLAASLAVVARGLDLSDKRVRRTAAAAVGSYRTTMAMLADSPTLDVWYARIDVEELLGQLRRTALFASATKASSKARRNSGDVAVAKLTETVDGVRRLRSEPPVLERIDDADVAAAVGAIYTRYVATLPLDCAVLLSRYSLRSAGMRVVGVGSVGTRALLVLLESGDGEPLLLQLKQAGPSVLERHLATSRFGAAHGRRVVAGQRLLQAAGDPFLGWADAADSQGHAYYVRQLRDMKGSIDAGALDPEALTVYGQVCGGALARAHARAGDASLIAGYLGRRATFDDAVAEFALGYVEVTEADHAALVAATAGPAGASVTS